MNSSIDLAKIRQMLCNRCYPNLLKYSSICYLWWIHNNWEVWILSYSEFGVEILFSLIQATILWGLVFPHWFHQLFHLKQFYMSIKEMCLMYLSNWRIPDKLEVKMDSWLSVHKSLDLLRSVDGHSASCGRPPLLLERRELGSVLTRAECQKKLRWKS